MQYDLAILGGGAAGLRAAYTAQDAGMRVALFEQSMPGGQVNATGHYAMERALRDLTGCVSDSYTAMTARGREEAAQLSDAVRHHLKTRGVRFIEETGVFSHRVERGFVLRGLEQEVTAGHLLLATGSLPAIPRLPGIDKSLEEGFVITSHDVLGARKLRGSAAVLGGSIRGAQLAVYYALLGVPVTLLLPAASGLAPELDREIAGLLGKALEARGVTLCSYDRLESAGRGRVAYIDPNGRAQELSAAALVLGAGRLPATRGLGFAELGVATGDGAVLVDSYGSTNVPFVYAAGECTLRGMTTEAAQRDADICVTAMTGRIMGYPRPSVRVAMHAPGQAVTIGETLDSATVKGLEPVMTKLPLPYTAELPGLIKLIGSRRGRKLIGAHLIGRDCTGQLSDELTAAVENGRTVDSLRIRTGTLTAEIAAEALFRLQRQLTVDN